MKKLLSILCLLAIVGISAAVNVQFCPTEDNSPLVVVKQRIFPAYGPMYLNLYDFGVQYPDCSNVETKYWRYWTYADWNATVYNGTYMGNESAWLEDLGVRIDYRKYPDGIFV